MSKGEIRGGGFRASSTLQSLLDRLGAKDGPRLDQIRDKGELKMPMDYITLVHHEKEMTQEQYEAKFPNEWKRLREIAGDEPAEEEAKK